MYRHRAIGGTFDAAHQPIRRGAKTALDLAEVNVTNPHLLGEGLPRFSHLTEKVEVVAKLFHASQFS